MLTENELKHYQRQLILPEIGKEGQERLKNAKVLVVGAGGLGCPVLLYLAAAGVGHIGIVDFDHVDHTNLHRQVLFGYSSIGKKKAIIAKEKLVDINPNIEIATYLDGLLPSNSFDIISQYDLIVDCCDNFDTRYLINDTCVLLNKSWIFASIYKFEGQVSVFNYNSGPTYRCLFPTPPQTEEVPNCSEIGVLGILPGIIGSFQANETLKLILRTTHNLSGQLLCFNALTSETRTFRITRKTKLPTDEMTKESIISRSISIEFCELNDFNANSIADIEQNFNQIIDLREVNVGVKLTINHLNIPYSELELRHSEIETNEPVLLICASGKRSAAALQHLKKNHNYKNLKNLKKGILPFLKN